jgi:ubiquitin-conjugating enzyme E2 variant
MQKQAPTYSRIHRMLEVVSIAAASALAAGLAGRIWIHTKGRAAWMVVVASAVTGYLLSDIVSGVVHWLADRFGTVKTPLVGANFIRVFREHHLDPEDITRHDFIETNGHNCFVSFPALAMTYAFPAPQGRLWLLFALALVLFLCLAIFGTNQFHKWAHMTRPPVLARMLQRAHLILPQAHHKLHHTPPFNTHYCITTGWFNALFRRLRVFERLERGLARVISIERHVEYPALAELAQQRQAEVAGTTD